MPVGHSRFVGLTRREILLQLWLSHVLNVTLVNLEQHIPIVGHVAACQPVFTLEGMEVDVGQFRRVVIPPSRINIHRRKLLAGMRIQLLQVLSSILLIELLMSFLRLNLKHLPGCLYQVVHIMHSCLRTHSIVLTVIRINHFMVLGQSPLQELLRLRRE